ncbi:MAG: hypothetical protein KAH22_10370 [Thiotrichaceae bacterium]|nr:hypothetical protein [Thiotrichaceae bacterium]
MNKMGFTMSVDQYDPITGFYYKSITKTVEETKETSRFLSSRSFSKSSPDSVVNIGILNPLNDEISLLFPQDQRVEIRQFIFEIGYDKESSLIEFTNGGHFIRNNHNIKKRSPNNHLLIVTVEEGDDTLWLADKKGTDLRKVTVIKENSNWHLDIKNSKIRVISSIESVLSVESFAW